MMSDKQFDELLKALKGIQSNISLIALMVMLCSFGVQCQFMLFSSEFKKTQENLTGVVRSIEYQIRDSADKINHKLDDVGYRISGTIYDKNFCE